MGQICSLTLSLKQQCVMYDIHSHALHKHTWKIISKVNFSPEIIENKLTQILSIITDNAIQDRFLNHCYTLVAKYELKEILRPLAETFSIGHVN